jgi:general secretion pathway protein G
MKKQQQDRRNRRAGITLIEMLVVITIIALFSAIAYQRLTPALEQGRRTAARTQIESLMGALQRYNIETGRFPTEEQGLDVLRPFLTKDIPLDPWKSPYIYRYPGEFSTDPELISLGADGQEGGDDANADVVSWQ